MTLLTQVAFPWLLLAMWTPVHALKQTLSHLIATSTVYTDNDKRAAAQAGAALSQQLQTRFDQVGAEFPGQPVLYSYSGDTCSFLTRDQSYMHRQGEDVQRRGRHLQEFLCEWGFAKAFSPTTGWAMRPLLKTPRSMNEGKKAMNHMVAASEHSSFKRNLHRGVILDHSVFDRAMQEPTARLLDGRRAAYYLAETDLYDTDSAREEDRDLHIPIHCGCSIHDMSNGYKRGLGLLGFGEVIKNAWLVNEMLRNGFRYIIGNALGHAAWCTVYDRVGVDDYTERRFWRFLCIPLDWEDLFAAVAPRWDGRHLHCRAELLGNPEATTMLSQLVFYVMRFRKFAEARWITVQNSTMCILNASLLGLRSLLDFTRAQPHVSPFYMHHADRLDPALQRYIPAAALSGMPPKAFMEDALEDDRLARRLPAVIENYRGEIALLEAAPWDTWQRISACFDGLSPAGLRDDVLHSTHACDGYVTNKSLRPLADYPWRLGSGDLEENIRELKAMPNSPSPDLCTTLVNKYWMTGTRSLWAWRSQGSLARPRIRLRLWNGFTAA